MTLHHQFRANAKPVLAFHIDVENSRHKKALLYSEMRWHISQHFFAEQAGEPILEHLLATAFDRKAKSILTAQLKDEKRHEKLFGELVAKYGIDERAKIFANGYKNLVFAQTEFAGKVFAFQILTEAVSSAYCAWRLKNFSCVSMNAADSEIFYDEEKHLGMGHSILDICDLKNLSEGLTAQSIKNLVVAMNTICFDAINSGVDFIISDFDLERKACEKTRTSTLDLRVAKKVLFETSKLTNRRRDGEMSL